MKLYSKGENNNRAYYYNSESEAIVKWKGLEDNKKIIVSKNVKNDIPTSDNNPAESGSNCFKANPIKHYRKQYIDLDSNKSGISKQSYIGNLDKPGSIIISKYLNSNNCENLNILQKGNINILNTNNSNNCNKNCNIIKPSLGHSVKIENKYSTTHKELLKKKCKTFNQNLPLNGSNNINCIENNCKIIYEPSNKKYHTQGAVSSSNRIATIRYCAQDLDSKRCKIAMTDYNKKENLSLDKCDCKTKKKSNIRILK
tara:strand:- start:1590 stop:2357 length:768 start_codon:yes stop_codon:yes gene_type:complete